jgi:acylphosphatase
VETVLFRVRGRVQDVGFRYWTQGLARRASIDGYVRNLRDGSIEVLARGMPEAISELRSALEHGPPGARVTSVYEFAADSRPVAPGFHVRR